MRARAPELLRKIPGPRTFWFEKLTSYRKIQTVLFLPIQDLGQVCAEGRDWLRLRAMGAILADRRAPKTAPYTICCGLGANPPPRVASFRQKCFQLEAGLRRS